MKGKWKGKKLKERDRNRIKVEARFQRIPKAQGRRRVTIELTFGKGGREADPDAYYKSTHDGLVLAGLLTGDSRRHLQITEPVFLRGKRKMTRIHLTDL